MQKSYYGNELSCWTRVVGVDVVRNEQMEEMLGCAVLPVWNVSRSFNPLTSTVISFS